MSNFHTETTHYSGLRGCECYKRLEKYGIPLQIGDEHDFYSEAQPYVFEGAFQIPGKLEINESIKQYMMVGESDLCNVFPHMATVIPQLTDYDVNLLNFWLLDMFIEGLWTAQNAGMNHKNQKATLLWIAYCFNYIKRVNPTRTDLFNHIKKNIFRMRFYDEYTDSENMGESVTPSVPSPPETVDEKPNLWEIPLPPDYHPQEEVEFDSSTRFSEEEHQTESDEENAENQVNEEIDNAKESEKNCEHMKIIFEILYRIFGRFWVYLEIQAVFHNMPPAQRVDLPFELHTPKPLLIIESPSQPKTEKYPKTFAEKLEEIDADDKDMYTNEYILPLQLADEAPSIIKEYLSGSNASLKKKNTTNN